ncbi:ABC transporter substrate-binding protein [Anaerocolumna xylanovorans]|nr:MetQ/NlpA family ABC transporter substrate-binding protein [Anaerocolumna xylanovorans]
MKKSLQILLTFCFITLLLAGCKADNKSTNTNASTNAPKPSKEAASENVTNAPETTAAPSAKTVLRIGMMSSYDVIPYVMINELGLADKYNLDLQLEVFTSAKDRDAAFLAGELDGVLTDYIGVCIYQNADFDVKITGITDGDYVLVAGKSSGITSMNDIKGKSIAISQNTLIDYTLDQILAKNSMESDSVVKEIVPRIPDRVELLRNNKIDLGLLPEPFASIVLNDGAVYLGSANDIGLYPAVSAFTKKVLDEKSEAVRDLYLAYNEAVAYINKTDISSYEDIVIKTVGYPEEMKGQITIEPFRESKLPPREDVESAIAWASKKELCSSDLTYEQMVYDVYSK